MSSTTRSTSAAEDLGSKPLGSISTDQTSSTRVPSVTTTMTNQASPPREHPGPRLETGRY
jgi:hypothetical protein